MIEHLYIYYDSWKSIGSDLTECWLLIFLYTNSILIRLSFPVWKSIDLYHTVLVLSLWIREEIVIDRRCTKSTFLLLCPFKSASFFLCRQFFRHGPTSRSAFKILIRTTLQHQCVNPLNLHDIDKWVFFLYIFSNLLLLFLFWPGFPPQST